MLFYLVKLLRGIEDAGNIDFAEKKDWIPRGTSSLIYLQVIFFYKLHKNKILQPLTISGLQSRADHINKMIYFNFGTS